MIDFTLFGFTLAVLLVGVWYACTSANVAGEDVIEDDGAGGGRPAATVVPLGRGGRRAAQGADRRGRPRPPRSRRARRATPARISRSSSEA